MNIAIRYYSKSGHTQAVAKAIAEAVNVTELSVDSSDAVITTLTDVLFIGSALYAYGIDSHMKDYLKTVNKELVKKVVIFSTSWISKHAIAIIKKELTSAGIEVASEFFYVRNKPSEEKLQEAKEFAKKFIQ